jgi:transcriptional regulator with GAF, ATPase, and Fis domain
VLGLVRAKEFLDGRMPLDRDAAVAAVGQLAKRLDLTVEETAAGILRINNMQAATVIRQQTVERGLDPRDFVLYAFGGAGPVHAFGYAAESGRNVSTLVFKRNQPARVDHFADDVSALAAAAGEIGMRSAVGAPISVEGRLWGVMIVASTHEDALPAGTEHRLAEFTELVATTIAKRAGARGVEHARRRRSSAGQGLNRLGRGRAGCRAGLRRGCPESRGTLAAAR